MPAFLRDIIGFETEGLEEASATVGSPAVNTSAPVRTGLGSLKCNGAATAAEFHTRVFLSGAEAVLGFFVRFNDITPTTDVDFFVAVDTAGTFDLRLRFEATSGDLILVDAGNSEIGSVAAPFTVDTWHLIELFWVRNGTTGRAEVHLDKLSVIGEVTGQDFINGAGRDHYRFAGGTTSGENIIFDDYYMYNESGGGISIADFLGDAEVFGYQTDGDSSATGTPTNGDFIECGDTPGVEEANGTALEAAGASALTLFADLDGGANARGHAGGPSTSAPYDVSGSIKGAKYIYNLKRSNGSGTSMRYIFGNTGDGETSSADQEILLGNSYAIKVQLSEAAGVVPTSSEDFSYGISAGTDDTGGRSIFAADIWAMLLHVPAEGGHTSVGAQTLPNYEQSATGAHPHSVAGTQALGDYLQSGSVTEKFTAIAIQLLEDYLQTGQVHMNPDVVGAQVLANYLQAGSPVQIFSASAVQTLADYLQSGNATSIEAFTFTGAQTLADYLQIGVVAHPHSVAGVQILGDFLQSGSAVQIFIATSAQSLPDFLQNGNGIMLPLAAGALTLADFEQAGVTVQIFLPDGAQVLADYLQEGSITHTDTNPVVGAQTLAELQQAGVIVMIPAGAGVQVLANFLQAASSLQIFISAGAQTLEDYLQSGVGLISPEGIGALILPDYLQSGSLIHTQTADFAGAQTLSDYLQSGAATHTQNVSATGAQTLPNYLQAATAVLIQPEGSGAQTLADYLQAGASVQIFSAQAVQALFNYLQTASGNEVILGSAESILESIIQTGSAVMAPVGGGASILSNYAQAGGGDVIFISSANQAILGLTQSGSYGISFNGVSAQTLADFVQNGNGAQVFIGAGAQTLAALAQAGTGVVVLAGPLFVAEFIALLDNPDIGVQSPLALVLGDAANIIVSAGGDTGV